MQTPFTFAGFTFPRAVAMLPKGTPAARLAKRRASGPSPCGPYTHAPKPDTGGAFFYLESDFAPGLRWKWADETDARIFHCGWFTDSDGGGDKIRGFVVRLPKARGFLAGWSMGESMASELETSPIYDDEMAAAYAADSLAKSVAENEREYQIAWQAGSRYSDLGEEVAAARRSALAILRDRKSASGSATLCAVIREKVESLLDDVREARAERAKLASGDAENLIFWPGDKRLAAAFNEGAGAQVLHA